MKNLNIKQRRNASGFTLIELVVVITILGILAAIALPKFVALQTDARISKLNAARGAVGAASATVHSGYLTRGGTADTAACPGGVVIATNLVNGTLCTEGGIINLANGYPASSALGTGGIISAAGLSSATFSPALADLNLEGFGATVAGTVTTISVIGGPGTTGAASVRVNATCSFTYRSPAAAGATPIITAVNTAGC